MVPDPHAPSLPAAAPYFSRPPFHYRDCPVIAITLRTDPHAAGRLVPEPLTPDPAGLMVLLIGRLHNNRLGEYREAILGAPCTLGERRGNYAVALYLDRASCIVAGREIWGWPKKDAELVVTDTGDRAAATASRDGVPIIRAGVDGLDPLDPSEVRLEPTWFNLKLIPSVTDGALPDVLQLTETTFANVAAREVRGGHGRIGFASTEEDPLADLVPVREVVAGMVMRLDFDLLDGVVVHDYLRGPASVAEAFQQAAVPA
jgi:acetoacetate decarboxylase